MADVRRPKAAAKKKNHLKLVKNEPSEKKAKAAAKPAVKANEQEAAQQPPQQPHPFAKFIEMQRPANAFRPDRHHFNPHLSKKRVG
jgi:hypothetical protein